MKNVSRLVFLLVAATILGGAAFLATWEIPAPKVTVEKVLPDDRYPR